MKEYVPQELIERPKMGFGIPIGLWIKDELREWTETQLSEESFDKHGLLNRSLIYEMWQKHLNGDGNYFSSLWPVIQFNDWYSKQT